jgi:hypothetical protein
MYGFSNWGLTNQRDSGNGHYHQVEGIKCQKIYPTAHWSFLLRAGRYFDWSHESYQSGKWIALP